MLKCYKLFKADVGLKVFSQSFQENLSQLYFSVSGLNLSNTVTIGPKPSNIIWLCYIACRLPTRNKSHEINKYKLFYLCAQLYVKIHAFCVSQTLNFISVHGEIQSCQLVLNDTWLSSTGIALSVHTTIDWNDLKLCGLKSYVQKYALTSIAKFHMPFKYMSFAC